MKRLTFAVALFAAACGGPAASQPAASQPASATNTATIRPKADAVSVVLVDFKIEPSTMTSGTMARFDVSNDGPTPHNLTVRGEDDVVIIASPDLREGESGEASGELAPGEYTIFCSFAGHESLGMRGTLTVNP